MVRKEITVYLVEGDAAPDLPVRFTGLDLGDYSSITMEIQFEDCTLLEKTVTPDGSDSELGHVAWTTSDLVAGRHKAEFKLVQTADSKPLRLPRKHTIVLNVRDNLE